MNCSFNASRFRALKPALELKGDMVPGLRSLRSLTRGYYLSSLRDCFTQTSALNLCWVRVFYFCVTQPISGCEWRESEKTYPVATAPGTDSFCAREPSVPASLPLNRTRRFRADVVNDAIN